MSLKSSKFPLEIPNGIVFYHLQKAFDQKGLPPR